MSSTTSQPVDLVMDRFDRIVVLTAITRNPGLVGEPVKPVIRCEQRVEAITEGGPTVSKLLVN
jgi:hypothetical protein